MALGNTAQRVIVALITIPLIIALSYFGKIYFFFFAAVIGLISYYEFHLLAKNKGVFTHLTPGLLAILSILIGSYYHITSFYSLLIIIVLVVLLVELFRKKGSAIHNIGATLLGIMYPGLFTSALISIREIYSTSADLYNQGGYIIIAVLASIWVCDSAAFFFGVRFGKHKLFPRISPKKSWEGAIAGFVFSVLIMIAAKFIVLEFLQWTTIIAFGIIVGIIGQIGDLVESMLKRDAGVKDSSALIPGHGGIFDRFDSLLYTAPVIFLYLKFVAL